MSAESAGVSIHAPVMGANRIACMCACTLLRFNPRTRDGCELIPRQASNSSLVSIHAPVMGANVLNQ